MEATVWLSYDLHSGGDYEGLYAWLDNHKAVECGFSVARFLFSFESEIKEELAADLKKNVQLDPKKDRVYFVSTYPLGGLWHGARRRPRGRLAATPARISCMREFAKLNTVLLNDEDLREQAMAQVREHGPRRRRSLVDAVIAEILARRRVDWLITVDGGFAEDCRRHRVDLCNLTYDGSPEDYGLL